MDIKLNARLSAYSKVDSILQSIESVTEEQIDTLFVDTPVDDPTVVTKSEIDSLFTDEEKAEAVKKSDIDGLFEGNITPSDNITSVSFSEIDSLFR